MPNLLEQINDILHSDDASQFEDVLLDHHQDRFRTKEFAEGRELSLAKAIQQIWNVVHPEFCEACKKHL